MLIDPLGTDPIVITGSANFSEASTRDNDENMLILCGNKRVAEICLGEFIRLYHHYAFREWISRLPLVLRARLAISALINGGRSILETRSALANARISLDNLDFTSFIGLLQSSKLLGCSLAGHYPGWNFKGPWGHCLCQVGAPFSVSPCRPQPWI
jgi:hypothetical protein